MNATVARAPLLMRFWFTPKTTHFVLPTTLEHETCFPAAVTLAEGETVTLAISDEEYVIVHCRVTGCAPPDAVVAMLMFVLPPRAAVPEASDSVTCCASKGKAKAVSTITLAIPVPAYGNLGVIVLIKPSVVQPPNF